MIEQHYIHVVPKMFSNQLSGMDMPAEAKEIKDRFDVPDKTKELFAKKARLGLTIIENVDVFDTAKNQITLD
jgi:hypothetical protein